MDNLVKPPRSSIDSLTFLINGRPRDKVVGPQTGFDQLTKTVDFLDQNYGLRPPSPQKKVERRWFHPVGRVLPIHQKQKIILGSKVPKRNTNQS